MQTYRPTSYSLFLSEQEIFDKLVEPDSTYRKLNEIMDFRVLTAPLRKLYKNTGRTGHDVTRAFKMLLVQFWEGYSDREMERAVKSNLEVRWFCGYSLNEDTPDHSYFGKLRSRLGAEKIAKLFNAVNKHLRKKGLFGDTFTFIDASSIITKTALWEERDKAIADGYEKLNNAVVNQYTSDKDAKWGAKSKNKVWFGFKRHAAVDMRYGLISKVATTPANVPDYKATKHICPKNQMVFSDKLYDCKENELVLKANYCHSGTIRKRNNPVKNKDLDSWKSKVRMPFECVFSKQSKRARYRGLVKVTFQVFTEAIVHNLKKAVKYSSLPALA